MYAKKYAPSVPHSSGWSPKPLASVNTAISNFSLGQLVVGSECAPKPHADYNVPMVRTRRNNVELMRSGLCCRKKKVVIREVVVVEQSNPVMSKATLGNLCAALASWSLDPSAITGKHETKTFWESIACYVNEVLRSALSEVDQPQPDIGHLSWRGQTLPRRRSGCRRNLGRNSCCFPTRRMKSVFRSVRQILSLPTSPSHELWRAASRKYK